MNRYSIFDLFSNLNDFSEPQKNLLTVCRLHFAVCSFILKLLESALHLVKEKLNIFINFL